MSPCVLSPLPPDTHAGVEALRGRLARMGVPARAYRLDTIARWAPRLATAFPATSHLPTAEPRTDAEFTGVYAAAASLLGLRPIREIIRASYSGVFIGIVNQCHHLAARLGGLYSCVEAVDTKDLYRAAAAVDAADGNGRAIAVIDFAAKCMTEVGSTLKSVRTALAAGRQPRVKKHLDVCRTITAVAEADSLPATEIERALAAMAGLPGAVVYRRELLRAMEKALGTLRQGEAASLEEAAWVVRNRSRRLGRVMPRCAVGTTLLVKGLEFDHAVVLDADGFDARNLYVALTRGVRSLTAVSREPVVRLKADSQHCD